MSSSTALPSTTFHASRVTDTALTALVPLIWGSTYVLTSEVLPPGLPFTAALLRTLPAGLLLLMLFRELPRREEIGKLLIVSALNIGMFQALLFVAAYRLPGGLAALAGATQPLVVMGLLWGVQQQRPAKLTLAASALGIAGMAALLLSPSTVFDPLGMLAAIGGALSMGCGTYLTKRWKLQLSVQSLTGWQLLIGGLMLSPIALVFDPPLPHLSGVQMLAYAYLGLVGSLTAYLLWFRGLRRLSPVAVSSLSLLTPVTAVTLGWLILGQALRGQALLGLLTVLGSVLLVQLSMNRSR